MKGAGPSILTVELFVPSLHLREKVSADLRQFFYLLLWAHRNRSCKILRMPLHSSEDDGEGAWAIAWLYWRS